MKVRVHAVNKSPDTHMLCGQALPHAISRVYDSDWYELEGELIQEKVEEFSKLGERATMLVEVVPVNDQPSWIKKRQAREELFNPILSKFWQNWLKLMKNR